MKQCESKLYDKMMCWKNGSDEFKFVLIKSSFACFLFTFNLKDLTFIVDDLQPSGQELALGSAVTYTLPFINEGKGI